MERKTFFEVFPDVKLNSELTEIFEQVEVTRITANRDRTKLRIYIESSRLINKPAILSVENELCRQLKMGKKISVQIMEHYSLSQQYTPKNLFDIYKDSIYTELSQKSALIATMYKKAQFQFLSDSALEMELETHLMTEERMNVIKNTIENIYNIRFNIPLKVVIKKVEAQKDKFKEQKEKKLRNEVEILMSRNKSNKPEKQEEKAQETPERPKIVKSTRSDNPDVVYGRDFEFDEETKIAELFDDSGEVVIKGQIFNMDERETRKGKIIVSLSVTDFTDSVMVKLFLDNTEVLADFKSRVGKGKFVRIKGRAAYDPYDKEVNVGHIFGMKLISNFVEIRHDTAVDKRIELHCHTKMSDMDGVSDVRKIVRRAYDWGHKAIAITDHGVVQGFPDAWHEYCDIKSMCKKQGKEFDFKVIYGVEAYLVDDLKDMITNPRGQSLKDRYVVFDIETTGFIPSLDKIIEIGAVKVENGQIVDRFSTFVNPKVPIPFRIEKLTGINDNMVIHAPEIEEVLPKFLEFCEGAIMVAHNADFDMSFISANAKRQGLPCDFTVVDTLLMARFLIIGLGRYKLDNVAKALGVSLENHHRAVDDAECTAHIFLKMCDLLEEKDIHDLDKANEAGKMSENAMKKAKAHHAIILVQNNIGRVNLYRLISISHIDTFANGKPRIHKSDYLKYKEGLIIGSACEAGELYQAILHEHSQQEIMRIADFYDYFEVQPLGNNQFMVKTGDPEKDDKRLLNSNEDLININKKIIELAKKLGKLTVATCDVHFLDPEDEMYRRIIQYGNGFKDADEQPPLYLRTTDEMLNEFSYLDSDLAEEIVITNPAKISDMIEDISPIHPDKCPPVLDNSEEELRNSCHARAKEIYGDPVPKVVHDRLEKELDSIIGNGYAVMYIMARRLVLKSNEDGYLVGSRGSVGSSFAATMSGITEVNPLKPHYYCLKCQYSEFDSEEIRSLNGGVGWDLPDKKCPRCGAPLHKDGIDTPFETFLGFNGDKEPDIDLNFSGEYQANAHAYTEVMFGKGHTFRAGTITGVADKTAFGYVKNYFEEHDIHKRYVEIDRIARGCTGIRKSTGQHPGGIVIVPRDKEIYEFTPIQKPANDMTTDTLTTHFEYHAIDANLLKLDILGHDDPTMIRRLEKLTGTNAVEIPFDDPKLMSLFESPEALGVTSEQIRGCPIGTLGLPEMGTDFVIQMYVDAKPKTIADLIRCSGLSHGTDVWVGNAQELIAQGKCTISTAICTRDDIMTYLIDKGIDPGISFKIMEAVRKGKGLTPENEQIMIDNGVPDWYIWSCKKIKYMFPKAHAAAYVMMALRVAYYKVYYPQAYYAAYFAIRAKAFNYELMCQGKERCEYYLDNLMRKKENNETSKKDEDTIGDLKVVQEMYARGYEFEPIDLYRAKAKEFQVIDGKVMPSFSAIEGMGDKAAEMLEAAAKDGKFLSKDDLRERAKVSKTVVETMSDLGLLDGMPEGNQLSIFDL